MTNTPPSQNDDAQSNEPAPLVEPTQQVEPVQPAEPAPLVEPTSPVEAAGNLAQPTTAEAVVEEAPETAGYEERIVEPQPTATAEPLPAAAPLAAPVQTVYVTAPTPPRKKGNRGFGALFALISLVVFAALFAGIIALVMLFLMPSSTLGESFAGFLASSAFWVPLVVFLVFFLLMVLIVNRAGWSVWVLGSFLVAVLVYFGSIGGILLASNIFQMTPEQAAEGFRQLALSAPVIVATVLAREVTIWFGAAIASRGRKVKVRNLESQAAFERELADSRAGIL